MKKKMNFIYYRPTLARTGHSVSLDAYFNKILGERDKYSSNISPLLKDIQLNKIIHHKEYALSSGAVCKAPLWELRFIHKRIDVPGIVDEKTNTIKAVTISTNQKIADLTILIYDSTTNLVIINSTQSGVSPNKIARFINHFVEDEENEITLAVLTDASIIETIKSNAVFTSISARLISMSDSLLSSQIDDIDSASLKSIIEVYRQSDTPQEFAATIDYNLKVNGRDKKAHLSLSNTLTLISDMMKLAKKGFVKKCRIKARNRQNEAVEEFDLLLYIIKDTHTFDITDTNRYISAPEIPQAMVLQYNTNRRTSFLAGKK